MVVHERPLVAMEVHGRFRLGQSIYVAWEIYKDKWIISLQA